MLAKMWHALSNVGVDNNLNPGISRYVILTNRFGLISGLISWTILCVLFLGSHVHGWTATRVCTVISGFLFCSVIIWNHFGYHNTARFMISWFPALLITFIAVFQKVLHPEYITVKDFFSYRILLLASTIIPLLIFSTKELRLLLINLIPSFIGNVFFDVFHRPFDVGFNQFGFDDPYFYIFDIIVALAYLGLVGFLLNQRYVTDNFELKLEEQRKKLIENNQELVAMNAFVNEQNHEMNTQAEKLKESNDALLQAKHTIEKQKRLLEDQNKNLEAQVEKKTRDFSRVNEELIIINNELRQFSHTLSHNLKSPVATFQGLLNLIEKEDLNKANGELLNYLNQSVERMQMVFSDMNEMLELRNQLYITTEVVNLQKEIDTLHNYFYPELIRNQISCNFKFECDMIIKTNAKRLNGILYQLISNAIKFRSEKREPEIQIMLNGNKDYHSIKIWDNGKGIDMKKYRHKLFYPYQQFHDQSLGKGLGLYLVKLQTESLGGKVTIKSQPDEYTEVEVLLKK